ncbi:MAG: murein biosynthesis integral membrane protein MurJ [Tetragenococcus koreensis]|nr:murein biosynthesis integral membrane protein MurJ [Tetragenococcus koreensis]MDN6735968.1 murein biosynthesis integral membrane protein MurJ [Tetragenococcus koreensis]
MKKTALLIIILTVISKIIGLGREVTLSYFYGATSISDAYLVALIIPTVISDFVGNAISTGFIPMYNKVEYESSTKQADKFMNNLINILSLVNIVLVALGIINADILVKIFASGFEGKTMTMAINFTRVSLIGVMFMTITQLFRSYLQTRGNYTVPALVSLPMNIVIILTVVLSSQHSPFLLSLGLMLSMLSQLIFLTPFVIKKGFKYIPTFNLKDKHTREMLYLALPVLLGVAVNDINQIVDKTIASTVTTGGISSLTYANNLNNFVNGVFVLSVTQAMYPRISKMSIQSDIEGLKKSVNECLGMILIFLVPTTLGIIFFAEPIIILLYGRGAFDGRAITMTSQVLFFYSLGMLGVGVREVLTRPFYALQDTKRPVINATIGVLFHLILSIILSQFIGVNGIALATSLSAILTALLMYFTLKKKIGSLGLKNTIVLSGKVGLASLIMGIVSLGIFYLLTNYFGSNISLLLTIVCAVLTYFFVLSISKIDVFDNAKHQLKEKILNKLKN